MAEVSGLITLDAFIRKLLHKKGFGNEMYLKCLQIVADGLQRIDYSHTGVVKNIEVDVDQLTGSVSYPGDYIDYVSVSVIDNNKLWSFTRDDKIAVYEIEDVADEEDDDLGWYLPTSDEFVYLFGQLADDTTDNEIDIVYGGKYWSSVEDDGPNAYVMSVANDGSMVPRGSTSKSFEASVRAVRTFISEFSYNVGDTGQYGVVFWSVDNNDGTFTYYEVAPNDLDGAYVWSNILSATGATADGIGDGAANTALIINQTGHVSSAALAATNY